MCRCSPPRFAGFASGHVAKRTDPAVTWPNSGRAATGIAGSNPAGCTECVYVWVGVWVCVCVGV